MLYLWCSDFGVQQSVHYKHSISQIGLQTNNQTRLFFWFTHVFTLSLISLWNNVDIRVHVRRQTHHLEVAAANLKIPLVRNEVRPEHTELAHLYCQV